MTTPLRTQGPNINHMSCVEITWHYNNTFGEKKGTFSLALSIFYSIFCCCTGGSESRRQEIRAAFIEATNDTLRISRAAMKEKYGLVK